jgi:hypothetical protein
MEQRQTSGLPASLINGRLEGLSVPDLLWNLCRNRSTGVLHVTARGITKKVYINEGRIVFALSGDPDDRLGDMLLREGLITLDQFEEAFTKLSSGKRLGTLLVDAGHLSPENLVRGVLSQVKGIVLGLFPLEEGEYAFAEGPLPTDEVITLGMRTAEILLQGIRQIRSFTRIRRSVGPPATRFRLSSSWRAILENLDIRDGERVLLQRLDDSGTRGVPVDALCREVFLSNFEIYQALWAFLILGVVEEVVRTNEGPKERSAVAELLVRLCREEVTGVLYMSRGTLERTLHIKEGACIFATSNAIDDGLVAHLLRRGVISLSDREETARRLLSNKRVGTILLEMGVIDEGDLLATVREQLSEIIFDTFRWEQGDFRFQPGELPTIEEITLNRSLEDLVFAGVRRVTSWSRVREGCGGLSARLVLLPKYLAVLDKMNVGPEEWELISLLKTPKSVLEICRESMLGDFRSCQILWALRLLGGVGEAPMEMAVDTAIGIFDAPPVAAEPLPPEPVAPEEAPAELETAAAQEPSPEPEAIPVSEADSSAEVISEPWRLAALRPTEEPKAPEPESILFQIDSVDDAPIEVTGNEVEAPIDAKDDGLPRFEIGEPGTGIEDMKIDLPPAALTAEVAAEPEPAAEPVPLPIDEAPAIEPADLDHTVRVSREELEAALKPAAVPPEPPAPMEPPKAEEPPAIVEPPVIAEPPKMVEEPTFEPPADLDGVIASFNARHVILFRALRAEIGAGAANFVRSCRGALDEGLSELFASAELRADGSWDPEGLKGAIVAHRIANAGAGFETLLEGELRRLRAHLGEARAAALADQLASIS